MVEGYDQKVFKSIYENTDKLRRKLAWQIDCRRFGVDQNEILSWFDVKFLHTFNRYYGKMDNDRLKAYIINSLQFFKQRILRFSYSKKAQVHNTSPIEDAPHQMMIVDYEYAESKVLLGYALDFIKPRCTVDSFRVLQIELNPPLYILAHPKYSNTKIPSNLIADYLGWGDDGVRRVNKARKEIKELIPTVKDELYSLPI